MNNYAIIPGGIPSWDYCQVIENVYKNIKDDEYNYPKN
jgi:hypothetical protein